MEALCESKSNLDVRVSTVESDEESSDESGEEGKAQQVTDEREVEEYRDRVEELENELREREERVEELESRVKRVQADFQNYKKRAEREKEKFAKHATADLVRDLLEVKDDLERALENELEREGVEMVHRKLRDVLEGEGVERVDTEGEPDPDRHEVVRRVESEEHEEGEIVEVFEEGYVMRDRVLRTAKVTVAEGSGDDGEAPDDDSNESV